MLALILAAVVAALAGPGVIVVDDTGAPVAAAVVTFAVPSGPPDVETTGRDGVAVPRTPSLATQATIDAPGFERAIVRLHGARPVQVVLRRLTPVIGAVRVATGSQQSLHRLPVPASVLDAAAIQSSPAATSDALLRALPGFDRDRSNSAFTNYGQLRVSFGGAGNDRGVVIADGLPAQDAFGGQIDWQ